MPIAFAIARFCVTARISSPSRVRFSTARSSRNTNRLKAMLKGRERKPLGTWLMSGSNIVAEAIGWAGFDFVVLDMEHSPVDLGTAVGLMQALAPQTGSSGGRGGGFPVMLVNGVRISSFREIRSYPPEAILKVEVFPEEVAQRYGYSPDQRVVNIILKRNYSSREVELEYGQPWDGGYSQKEVEATYLQLIGEARLNFNLGNRTGQLDDPSYRLSDGSSGSALICPVTATHPSIGGAAPARPPPAPGWSKRSWRGCGPMRPTEPRPGRRLPPSGSIFWAGSRGSFRASCRFPTRSMSCR